jgi:hypothetical protein
MRRGSQPVFACPTEFERLAGAPKTTLEQLFGLMPANALETPQNTESNSSLALGDQVETEGATEIEKGS